MESQLIRYNAAKHALAEAKSVDEVKDIRDKATAIQAYARQAEDRAMEIDAAEIRVRAERRLGILLEEQPVNKGMVGTKAVSSGVSGAKKVPVKDTTPTLADQGISKKLSARSKKVAAIPEPEFEEAVSNWREESESMSKKISVTPFNTGSSGNSRAAGTGNNEWYTPPEYVELARLVLGHIDLDPASNEYAQSWIQAGQYFTQENDALFQDWRGTVWLNPPYAQPGMTQFIEKFLEEFDKGDIPAAILLTHNTTETKWFQKLIEKSTAICFPSRRIPFVSETGEKAQPVNGQAFFYFNNEDDPDSFIAEFYDAGAIMMRANDR